MMSARPLPSESEFLSMRLADVPLVGLLERRNYEFPWNEAIFRDCLKAGYICRLLRIDDEIVGYGILQIGADEGHVLNLCIDLASQRRGYARLLLEYLIDEVRRRRGHTIFLEVRPSNPRAQTLYAKAGFNEVGVRRDYYDAKRGREDAIVMAMSLDGETLPTAGRPPNRSSKIS